MSQGLGSHCWRSPISLAQPSGYTMEEGTASLYMSLTNFIELLCISWWWVFVLPLYPQSNSYTSTPPNMIALSLPTKMALWNTGNLANLGVFLQSLACGSTSPPLIFSISKRCVPLDRRLINNIYRRKPSPPPSLSLLIPRTLWPLLFLRELFISSISLRGSLQGRMTNPSRLLWRCNRRVQLFSNWTTWTLAGDWRLKGSWTKVKVDLVGCWGQRMRYGMRVVTLYFIQRCWV